jgi:general secretion pathway protein M
MLGAALLLAGGAATLAVGHALATHTELEALRQRLTTVRAAAREGRSLAEVEGTSLLVAGSTAGRAAAEVQDRLGALSRAAGIQLRSLQVVDPKKGDGLTEVAIELTGEASPTTLRKLLYDIETGSPLLIVQGLGVRALVAGQGAGQAPPRQQTIPLEVQVKVKGFAPVKGGA